MLGKTELRIFMLGKTETRILLLVKNNWILPEPAVFTELKDSASRIACATSSFNVRGASANGGVQLGSVGRNAKIAPVNEYFAPVPATIGKTELFSQ